MLQTNKSTTYKQKQKNKPKAIYKERWKKPNSTVKKQETDDEY